jgi:nitroimidazol reductase NimA-like FMN-containing flavoprotein (pyridoxamine 5'-phosphate oxidase superfamily)
MQEGADTMNPAKYHPRRTDREITTRAQMVEIIRRCHYLTLALCQGDEPYLVALNYGFDEKANCFYVHAATRGRKLEVLRANPRVWGMIIDDLGYVKGECSHHYRSVMFEGRATFVEDDQEKSRGLAIMIDDAEKADMPEMKARLAGKTAGVVVLRIDVTAMSGKASPPLERPAGSGQ